MSDYIGDVEPGQVITPEFQTIGGNGTLTGGFTNEADTGDPAIAVRNASTGATTTTGVSLAVNAAGTGSHRITIDTTQNASFFSLGKDFEIIITDGRIDDGSVQTVVTGLIIRTFTMGNRADGFVLDRSHKIFSGTVVAVTDASRFRVTGVNIDTGTTDYYIGGTLQFQPPSQNQGVGRVIGDFDPNDGTMRFDTPFPKAPVIGDPFDLLHVQQLPVWTANITWRPGIAPLDDLISVEWHRDGALVLPTSKAVQELPTMDLEVATITVVGGVEVVTIFHTFTNKAIHTATGAFYFIVPGLQTPVSNGIRMKGTAVVQSNQRPISFSRTMFVYP